MEKKNASRRKKAKKLTVSRKKAKLLTINRKSHYPIETLLYTIQYNTGQYSTTQDNTVHYNTINIYYVRKQNTGKLITLKKKMSLHLAIFVEQQFH